MKKGIAVQYTTSSGPRYGFSPCNDVGDPVVLPPPILSLFCLFYLKNDKPKDAAASSSTVTISYTLTSGSYSIENPNTPGRSVGIGLAGCPKEENIIHEEEIPVFCRKGIEGRNGTQ